jgi:hypothetical protein
MPKIAAISAVSAMLFTVPAVAQDLMRDMQRECMADAQKLCKEQIGNPNTLIQCMIDKRPDLAPGCQPVVDRAARALGIEAKPAPAQNLKPASNASRN